MLGRVKTSYDSDTAKFFWIRTTKKIEKHGWTTKKKKIWYAFGENPSRKDRKTNRESGRRPV